jgi:ABC-type antimicrobial peptide transport system permease subunit
VQNTYLQIFLALGALGLLIGTAGVGVIVLRNIAERQSELAWLSVAGYSRTAIAIMLFTENFIIVLLSVLCSLPAIGIILLPGFIAMNVNIPWLEIAVFFASLIAVAGMVIAASSYYAIRKSLVRILINE